MISTGGMIRVDRSSRLSEVQRDAIRDNKRSILVALELELIAALVWDAADGSDPDGMLPPATRRGNTTRRHQQPTEESVMTPEKLTAVRRPKQENRDELARQMVEAEAQKAVILPPLSDDEMLERRGIEATRKANATHLECAAAYFEIYTNKLNERRGYGRPSEYFETVIGVSWRSAQQGIAIWESALAITEGERPAARLALEQIGAYRSAVIAPILKEQPGQWAEWTALAADRTVSREALQEKVSRSRGLPPTNSKKAGDRLYGTFVSLLSAEERVEFEE